MIDVQYRSASPYIEFFEEISKLNSAPPWHEVWPRMLSMGMAVKSLPWSYEEEVRVLRKVSGIVTFDAQELSEIVFGMNMPMQDRIALRELLKANEWAHVRYREIVRTDGFSVTIQDTEIN